MLVIIQKNGTVKYKNSFYSNGWSETDAVPVPEHGRLGDLEQAVIILDRIRDHCRNEDMAFALNWVANAIRGLPTIIPADPAKEED